MKIIVQIGIVFAVCLLGEFISSMIPFPFPSSVIGMALLFMLFFFKIIKPEQIRQKTNFMLQNMAVFFVPGGVGLISNAEFLRNNGIALLIICVVSTILTFLAAAYTVKAVMALQSKFQGRKKV